MKRCFSKTPCAHWFWTRAQAAHTALLDAIAQEARKANPSLSAAQSLACGFTDEKNAKRLWLMLRYETAAERTFRRNLADLERALAARARIEKNERYAAFVAARAQAEESAMSTEIGFVSHAGAAADVAQVLVPAPPTVMPARV